MDIRLPQRDLNPVFEQLTLKTLHYSIVFSMGAPSGTTFLNSGFDVHSTTLTYNFWYNNKLLNLQNCVGWAAFERNGVRNIPFLSKTVQPNPLNRFPLYPCPNAHCFVLVCSLNHDFEIMPQNNPKAGF